MTGAIHDVAELRTRRSDFIVTRSDAAFCRRLDHAQFGRRAEHSAHTPA